MRGVNILRKEYAENVSKIKMNVPLCRHHYPKFNFIVNCKLPKINIKFFRGLLFKNLDNFFQVYYSPEILKSMTFRMLLFLTEKDSGMLMSSVCRVLLVLAGRGEMGTGIGAGEGS